MKGQQKISRVAPLTKRPTVLAIDSNTICHAAKHTTKKWAEKGIATGVIYGFLSKILILIERFNPDTVVFVWDNIYSKRKEIYPGYKYKRHSGEKTQDEMDADKIAFAQFDQLRDEILVDLGFDNVFSEDGYEADDILAVLATNREYDLVVVTTDHDMYQILSPTCEIFDPRSNVMITKDKFCDKYGIEPVEWGFMKAIAGCGSDTVDGISGVGEKTAIKYIRGELGESTKAYVNIEAGLDTIVTRNAELVILPMEGIGEYKIVEHGLNIHIREFVNMCERFKLKSFLSSNYFDRWKKALRME